MIKIRLSRGGKKNDPFYRIVAIEKHRKRDGEPLDILGFWNPGKKDLSIDKKKYKMWVSRGAQTSETVSKLITNVK